MFLLLSWVLQSIFKKYLINITKNKFVLAVIYIATISLSIFLLLFAILCVGIRFEVKTQCHNSQREYGGDCAEDLILVLQNERRSFRERNNAIWVLGQLGDQKSLPVLQNFYTGVIPLREPLDEVISQYELKKAIDLISGGSNIPSVFWRHGMSK